MAAPSSRRPLAVRSSLRMLLLALTAFAIGFPIWYRWPYEERVDEPEYRNLADYWHAATWQRQWGGGRIRHGRQYIRWKGKVMRSEMYQQDLLHGPCEYHESIGSKETGQYVNGKKSGEWKSFNSQGKLIQAMTWKEGVLHGLGCSIR
jgi:hypothetical protein